MNISLKNNQLYPYVFAVVLVVFLLLRVSIIFLKGTDLGGIEQNVIYSTQVLIDSGNLYLSPGSAPFSITQYTPLYYYICGFTAKIAGYENDNIQLLYVIGRSWNLVFNLVTALLIFKISRHVLFISRNRSYLLFLLSFVIAYSYDYAVRPDSLCDMLGIAAFYFFLLYKTKPYHSFRSSLLLVITVLITALAVFSKQNGIQLVIILCGFSFLIKDWRTFFRLILFSVFIYGGLLLVFNYLYPSFFENVVGGIANGIDLKNFFTYVFGKRVFIISGWPLIFISVYLLIRTNSVFKGNDIERFLAIATLGTLIFASATALKMGSGINYYILFINTALLFTAYCFGPGKFTQPLLSHSRYNYQKVILPLYVFLVIMMLGAYNYKIIKDFGIDTKLDQQRMAALRTAGFIKKDMGENNPAYIFANITTDSYIPSRQAINNIFFKNCLVPQMDILEYSTARSKVIGYQNLENMFREGKVGYIIASQPQSKFVLLKDLEKIKKLNYTLIKNIEGYLIYKLNKRDWNEK